RPAGEKTPRSAVDAIEETLRASRAEKDIRAAARAAQEIQRTIAENPFGDFLLTSDRGNADEIRFVAIQVLFKDGTRSDVQIRENPRAK
ncbi:MAG: hypothetical protein LBT15_01155, partial [Synergistaceae bacterium]|nr:hypothetical protein [Synergistaceae bacterium]